MASEWSRLDCSTSRRPVRSRLTEADGSDARRPCPWQVRKEECGEVECHPKNYLRNVSKSSENIDSPSAFRCIHEADEGLPVSRVLRCNREIRSDELRGPYFFPACEMESGSRPLRRSFASSHLLFADVPEPCSLSDCEPLVVLSKCRYVACTRIRTFREA